MARKSSEYESFIQFYKPGDPQPPSAENGWQITPGEPVPHKKIWCHVETIFREQLESYLDGVNINRKRIRLYMRLRKDIDSTMTFEYRRQIYNVSIYGDVKGETQLLGEVPEDGGV